MNSLIYGDTGGSEIYTLSPTSLEPKRLVHSFRPRTYPKFIREVAPPHLESRHRSMPDNNVFSDVSISGGGLVANTLPHNLTCQIKEAEVTAAIKWIWRNDTHGITNTDKFYNVTVNDGFESILTINPSLLESLTTRLSYNYSCMPESDDVYIPDTIFANTSVSILLYNGMFN